MEFYLKLLILKYGFGGKVIINSFMVSKIVSGFLIGSYTYALGLYSYNYLTEIPDFDFLQLGDVTYDNSKLQYQRNYIKYHRREFIEAYVNYLKHFSLLHYNPKGTVLVFGLSHFWPDLIDWVYAGTTNNTEPHVILSEMRNYIERQYNINRYFEDDLEHMVNEYGAMLETNVRIHTRNYANFVYFRNHCVIGLGVSIVGGLLMYKYGGALVVQNVVNDLPKLSNK